jgi:signal transduction histidine kinase
LELQRSADQVWLSLAIQGEEGQAAGCLILTFPPDAELDDQEARELQAALEAVVTVGRASFELRTTEERLNRFRHLYDVGQAISSTLELQEVLRQSTERMADVLHAEASTLMLIDEARQELVFTIPAGPAQQILREHRMPLDRGVAGWVATHGQPIIISDVTADTRFYITVDQLSGFRTRSIMAVPLQVKGKTIGVAEVINKKDGSAFTADDQQWLSILAPLIATAIDNARLFAALREEHDRIIAAEEKVRHDLARDLHDGPAQILAAMILNIDVARRQFNRHPERMLSELNYLESLAQEANHEVRNLLFSLRPLVLETHGLKAALAQLIERHRQRAPYGIDLDVSAMTDEAIDGGVASTLFVITQEALTNIFKHAHAQKVMVRLGITPPDLWVEIEDDGVGFDVKQVEQGSSERGSFGVLNIRERARLIDGRAEFISPRPDGQRGTQVRVQVPLERVRRTAE